jgi:hypothetical protein
MLKRVAQKSRATSTTRSPPSHESESSPCNSSFSRLTTWTSEDLSLFSLSLAPSSTGYPTSSSTNSTPSPVSPGEYPVLEPETIGEFGPRIPREGSASELVLFREATPKPHDHTLAVVSPFSIHPFVRLPSIPRGVQAPLSLLDPEFLQASDRTSSELDLSLYAFSLKLSQLRVACAESYSFSRLATLLHLRKLGIRFTSRKEDAIMCGDTSGNVVHPFFVHSSNAVGMHLRAGVEDSPTMLQLHAKHSQRALEQMSEAGKSGDAELKAQMSLYGSNNCYCPRLRFPLCVPFPSIPDEHRVFAEEMGATGKADLAAMKGESGICGYIHRYVCRYSKRANSGITKSRTNKGLARTVRRKISQLNESLKNAQCYSAPST